MHAPHVAGHMLDRLLAAPRRLPALHQLSARAVVTRYSSRKVVTRGSRKVVTSVRTTSSRLCT